MVVLPPEFVATRYPGYFWNTSDKKLYSIKVTGELRPLKYSKGGTFYGHTVMPGYHISHNGMRRTLPLNYLMPLKPTPKQQVIKIAAS